MSRKSKRNRPDPSSPAGEDSPVVVARRHGRRGIVAGIVVALLVATLAVLALRQHATPVGEDGHGANAAALASAHSPTLGEATARVHVVEFLDPACETCAQFFPVVKQLLADNPGRIRLSVRHVAFHEGAEYAIRVLEASRNQQKYWQTLEALLQTQSQWAPHHTVQPDRVDAAIAGVGLDMRQLAEDMDTPVVGERIARDRDDARTLKVTATPEYFVNGRPLPEFGYQPLVELVHEELARAY
jgi:protein-disulfide isomerase